MSQELDPLLLEVIACPLDHHTKLEYDPSVPELRCPTCQTVYVITDGIPVLLPPGSPGATEHG